jgi:hypothetical protein
MSILETARQYLLDEDVTCSPDDGAQRAASKARTAIVLTRDRLHTLAEDIDDEHPDIADELREIAGPIQATPDSEDGEEVNR